MTFAEDSGIFASIAGLPLHPLVVHVVVVFLPVSALGLITLVAVPRWRKHYGVLAVAVATMGAAGAFVAKESGDALADQVGLPRNHEDWGERLSTWAIVFAAVAIVWLVLDRRRSSSAQELHQGAPDASSGRLTGALPMLARLAGALVAVLSLVVLVLTAVVGHSGAEAAWADRTSFGVPSTVTPSGSSDAANPPAAEPGTAESGPAEPGATAPGSGESATSPETTDPSATDPSAADPSYTLAEIAEHGSRESCWAAINGEVYDLTDWIDEHPGGIGEILGVCGTDASADFRDEHDGDDEPRQELTRFRIGRLG
ncbi:cytochrome b5 domain-containing protein [Ornithinimicrobium cryptoxanthini]|uniref:Cytochrome b5 heme-binding domain-containing protein n=1 Tax=Ornithinimicrobium cryptoxanthini TaxID=2934161 RepID=A0ABY4YMV9_9MICO|nr:cytochrome b5 domain-containing protein [Ornithinimicrobium cryptoxanthini]USQ77673.1 hypothetical protein NF557_07165 [Ornithinimicrobium cryptoxanthini]